MGFFDPIWMHLVMTHMVIFNSSDLDLLVSFFVQVIVLGRMALNTIEGLWLPKEIPAENRMQIRCCLRPENKVPLALCWFHFIPLSQPVRMRV